PFKCETLNEYDLTGKAQEAQRPASQETRLSAISNCPSSTREVASCHDCPLLPGCLVRVCLWFGPSSVSQQIPSLKPCRKWSFRALGCLTLPWILLLCRRK